MGCFTSVLGSFCERPKQSRSVSRPKHILCSCSHIFRCIRERSTTNKKSNQRMAQQKQNQTKIYSNRETLPTPNTIMNCKTETSSLLTESSSAPPHLIPQRLKKSPSIPIQNHMKRTGSELKLRMDEEMADNWDYLFYARVVDGIAHRQRGATESRWLRQETDECLAHIIWTRHGCLDRTWWNPACVKNRGVNSSSDDVDLQQWINETEEIFEMDM